jgi:hypothetical protein
MDISYSELIRTALEHYQQGARKPKQPTSLDPGHKIKRRAEMIFQSRLSLADQLVMSGFTSAINQGLAAARQGQFLMAEQFFVQAREPLLSDKLSTEGHLICKSFQEAAEAYLDYRRGDFSHARAHMLEALATDIILEEEYGYDKFITHSHRLEFAINLVRIDARWMRFERAVDLADSLLGYLEGGLEVLPLPGSWSRKLVELLPPELSTAHFVTIASEVAPILADKNRQVAGDLFTIAARHTKLKTNSNCHYHPGVHAWFLVKEAFLSNEVVTFLERVSHFLSEGRADTPVLWYATVVDLLALCNQLDLPVSKLVRQAIVQDAVTWENIPQSLLCLLDVSAHTQEKIG